MNILDAKIKIARKRLLSSEGARDWNPSGNSMMVIIESEEDELKEAFLKLREHLKISEENFFFLLCPRKTSKNDIFATPCFTAADLNWTGNIKNENLKEFFDKTFDVVVSFAASENKLAAFAVSVAGPGLKVGRESSSQIDFDLLIATQPEEPELFTTELEKYLKILKTEV